MLCLILNVNYQYPIEVLCDQDIYIAFD